MKKLWLIGLIGFVSCTDEWDRNDYVEPDIPRETFIPVLVELHLLEAHYHRLYSRPDVYKKALDSASGIVFSDHGMTREGYYTALEQFSYSSDTIYKIYEAALDTVAIRISTIE